LVSSQLYDQARIWTFYAQIQRILVDPPPEKSYFFKCMVLFVCILSGAKSVSLVISNSIIVNNANAEHLSYYSSDVVGK